MNVGLGVAIGGDGGGVIDDANCRMLGRRMWVGWLTRLGYVPYARET